MWTPAGCSPFSVLVSLVTTIFRLSSSLRRRMSPRHFGLWARMVAVMSNELSVPASSLLVRPVIETRQLLHHPLSFLSVFSLSVQASDPCLAIMPTDTRKIFSFTLVLSVVDFQSG